LAILGYSFKNSRIKSVADICVVGSYVPGARPIWNWNLRGIFPFRQQPGNRLKENVKKQDHQKRNYQAIVYLEGYRFGYKAECHRFDGAEFCNAKSG
jgi:hypothetical protein